MVGVAGGALTLPVGDEGLAAENAWLRSERDRLEGEVARLTSTVARLRARLDEARRAAKRQAAPFAKGRPVSRPRRPGRKPGPGYGVKARRPVPDRVDRAIAVTAWLSKGLGLPAGKVSRLLGQFGLALSPGGVHQGLARAARVCQPTYRALEQGVRDSPVVAPDETGWRVAGCRAWLWAFVGDRVVVYQVAAGRGYADAAQVLGENYAGVLERDGWAPYRRFTRARHQSCLAHLLRRCRELISDADRGQARTPHAVRRILTHALASAPT